MRWDVVAGIGNHKVPFCIAMIATSQEKHPYFSVDHRHMQQFTASWHQYRRIGRDQLIIDTPYDSVSLHLRQWRWRKSLCDSTVLPVPGLTQYLQTQHKSGFVGCGQGLHSHAGLPTHIDGRFGASDHSVSVTPVVWPNKTRAISIVCIVTSFHCAACSSLVRKVDTI